LLYRVMIENMTEGDKAVAAWWWCKCSTIVVQEWTGNFERERKENEIWENVYEREILREKEERSENGEWNSWLHIVEFIDVSVGDKYWNFILPPKVFMDTAQISCPRFSNSRPWFSWCIHLKNLDFKLPPKVFVVKFCFKNWNFKLSSRVNFSPSYLSFENILL
jgi:hypothetical protein